MLNENRFLGTFRGHSKRPSNSKNNKLYKLSKICKLQPKGCYNYIINLSRSCIHVL
jgi:hypothetical protein